MKSYHYIFIALCLFGIGCDGPEVEPNLFNATIEGDDFQAASAGWTIDSTQSPHRFLLSATDSSGNQLLIKINRAQVGTYAIELTDGVAEATYINGRGTGSTTDDIYYFGESGAIELQEVTMDRVKGIFLFDAIDINDPDGSVLMVTNGEFTLGVAE